MPSKRILLVVALLASATAVALVAAGRFSARAGTVCFTVRGDVNCDCMVDLTDFLLEAPRWNQNKRDGGYNPGYDLDGDGRVSLADLASVLSRWGRTCRTDLGLRKGINYVAWWQSAYQTPAADQALDNLAATGANWVALVVTGYQQYTSSTSISRSLSYTPSDADLVHVLDRAHKLGLKVMLKPHLDLTNDSQSWRALIGFKTEADWAAWFASYRSFINHYAELAQAHGAEALVVGVELQGTSKRETEWRRVVAEVRQRYSGPITYAANFGGEETAIKWWDALDYIGVDAYYKLSQKDRPSLSEIKAGWQKYILVLERLSKKYGRPVILTEIGYRSIVGTSRIAGDWKLGEGRPVDLLEQANAYQAFFETVWGKPWLAGAYFWNWPADSASGGPTDNNYTPYKKPAEQVLRLWYGGRTPTQAGAAR